MEMIQAITAYAKGFEQHSPYESYASCVNRAKVVYRFNVCYQDSYIDGWQAARAEYLESNREEGVAYA